MLIEYVAHFAILYEILEYVICVTAKSTDNLLISINYEHSGSGNGSNFILFMDAFDINQNDRIRFDSIVSLSIAQAAIYR